MFSSFIIVCLFVFHFVNNAREPSAFFTCLGERNIKNAVVQQMHTRRKKEIYIYIHTHKGQGQEASEHGGARRRRWPWQKPAANSQGREATRGVARPTASISRPGVTANVSPPLSLPLFIPAITILSSASPHHPLMIATQRWDAGDGHR